MSKKLIRERIHRQVTDILLSPSALRRIYEEEKRYGNDVSLYPGMVVLQLKDGEVNFIWKDGKIVEQVYVYEDAV